VGTTIEGPAVVPRTLGPHGGEIWVAAQDKSSIFSINVSGDIKTITKEICNPENITVIPAAPTNFGTSGGSYFAADFPTRIIEYPASDFFSFGGNVLVGTEPQAAGSPSQLKRISFTDGDYKVSPFDDHAFKGGAEGAAFVQTLSHPFIYAAKFVCGIFRGAQTHDEGPVEPGSYTTTINVHNPNYCPITIVKKAVLLFSTIEEQKGPETPTPPYKTETVKLDPGWGLKIDCFDIRTVLLRQPSGDYPKAPIFIEGFVVIESPEPLDVVAVYTVRGLGNDSSISIETDRVIPNRLS
jgi:hypothetical protein